MVELVRYMLGKFNTRSSNGETAGMGKQPVIALILILFLACTALTVQAQVSDSPFKLLNPPDRSLAVRQTFSKISSVIDLDSEPVSGLSVSGTVTLNSDSSFVRIIMVDRNYREHLVWEVYPLLAGGKKIDFSQVSEETALLDNVRPGYLRIELNDATCSLDEIQTSRKSAESILTGSFKELLRSQQRAKLDKIKSNIHTKKLSWEAGETSLSHMTYAEKKALFGGTLPNLNGFEYYRGGIFTLSSATAEKTPDHKASSVYTPSFDWRNRHGIDWTTPARNQGSCGSCWAFSTTGATELMVNLYFNRKIDVDLAEQNLVSHVEGSSCSYGYPGDALRYIRNYGIVSESCMPYTSSSSCEDPVCSQPEEKIHVSGINYFSGNTEDQLKKFVMDGPVSLGINSWRHTVTLVGYRSLNAGDTIRYQENGGKWYILSENDPLAGRTAWIIKNSWGANWGDNGFAYLVLDMSDISSTYQLSGSVSSLQFSEQDILCTDSDGDGYYTWGIGPKPAHCPASPDQPDSDDSDPCIGPADEYGNPVYLRPEGPLVKAGVQCEFGISGKLIAQGEEIKWYSDENLLNLVHEGDTFMPGMLRTGSSAFYATQTLDGCESAGVMTQMILEEAPDAPLVTDIELCEGEILPDTGINGETIRWYPANEDKTGNVTSYAGEAIELQTGIHLFLAASFKDGCESARTPVYVIVNALPELDLGADRKIQLNESLELSAGSASLSYNWFDGETGSERIFEGYMLGEGDHTIWVNATDRNSCSVSDTVSVSVSELTLARLADNDAFRLFPNPTEGVVTIQIPGLSAHTDIIVSIVNQSGQQVHKQLVPGFAAEYTLDITNLPSGYYHLLITAGNVQFSTPLIRK